MTVMGATMALALAIGAAEAHATVNWAVPGSSCNPRLTTDNRVDYGAYGINPATTGLSAEVVCGGATIQGTSLDQFNVQVFDRSATEDVSCQLSLMDATGGLPSFTTTKVTTGLNQLAAITLGFGTVGTANSFSLSCHLPPPGGLGVSGVSIIKYRSSL